ncbi:MAG: putative N-acetylmannosamine-6-phosphate 2-epimerase [Bryobacterales bacterium]|nr:putative N-acetylmannosamine-6-phosphate 2-epimerase [Bryobacterales bacterium]
MKERLARLQGKLLVSCQASEGDAFHDPPSMARFARAAVRGGAAGIRANGPADIAAIRAAVDVPIVGIQKRLHPDGRILITPGFDDARALVEAGADMIALDSTARGQRYGALERLARIKAALGVPVLADIATVEEAVAAARAGADFVLSTMRGYTEETAAVQEFQPGFIRDLVAAVPVPVIAEGRIRTPDQAAAAIRAGAFAVIVGSAVTRPHEITDWFARAVGNAWTRLNQPLWIAGIDLGGTNTKFGLVSRTGELRAESFAPTPSGGRQPLLDHLKSTGARVISEARAAGREPAALGVATAGWVDPAAGRVVYATENLPGWTGTPIAGELSAALGLPVAVENDANSLAVAEHRFGAGRDSGDFVCITLGTGVGGGCYTGGRLNRGSHFFANALGHIRIEADGLPCTCGQRGCLEVYSNAAALLRYAGPGFQNAEQVVSAAKTGNQTAVEAVRILARRLAQGCSTLVHLLDPELLILSGGIAQDNQLLIAELERELAACTTVWEQRRLRIRLSPLAYYGGVLGAAAVALEHFDWL